MIETLKITHFLWAPTLRNEKQPFFRTRGGRVIVFLLLNLLCFPVIQSNAQRGSDRPGTTFRTHSFGETDTSVIRQKIAGAQRLAETEPATAAVLLNDALSASLDLLYAAGARHALRSLLNLLTASERSQLLNELKFRCRLSPPLWGVLPVIYNAMAKGYQLQGNYEQAAQLYMKAIPLSRQYVPSYLAVLYNNYGSLILLLPENSNREHLQSLYYLDEAQKIASRHHDEKTITCILCNKGKVFRKLKRYEESLNISKRALEIAQRNGYRQWEFVLLNNIGDLYYIKKQPQKALWYLKQTEAIKDSTMDPYYLNMSVFTLGEVYEMLGQNKKAEAHFLAALKTARIHHIGRDLIAANKKLATFYQHQNNYAHAYQHLKEYSQLSDSLKNEEMLKNIQDLSVKYQTSENKKKLLQKELYIAHQQHLLQQKNRLLLLASIVAILIIIVLHNRFRHKKRILLKEEKIKEMHAILRGEEKERIRLAQELHDGIGGMLAAANMHLEVVRKNEFQNELNLSEVSQLINTTAEEVREISHNLMPAALFRRNLDEALRYYCNSIQKHGSLSIDLHIYGPINLIPALEMTFLFRAVQELIQNIMRHANANHALISLERTENRVQLIVEDDGNGFDPKEQRWGFGLENLSRRVQAFKGIFELSSEKDTGTSITIEFPVTTGKL